MAKDAIGIAEYLMRRRQFDKAIDILEVRAAYYEGNLRYFVLLGTAYLYTGDTGSATVNFQKARGISLTDINLLLGQAAIFLRRGDTDRAINYYMDILDKDPSNKTAFKAMEFIRTHGDFDTICKWNDSGKLKKFYPPLGFNPNRVWDFVFPVLACALGFFIVFKAVNFKGRPLFQAERRTDLSAFNLSIDERASAQESDLSSGAYRYILSAKEINSSYEKALKYFQGYSDNLSQIEINRILNSNASLVIKRKARALMGYLESPSFDTIKDSPSFEDVESESPLYLDCWVSWSGRISNVVRTETSFECDFLVGYETMEKLEGIVRLRFAFPPDVVLDKPVSVLAKISSDGGKLLLEGKSVYQSVNSPVISKQDF